MQEGNKKITSPHAEHQLENIQCFLEFDEWNEILLVEKLYTQRKKKKSHIVIIL